MHAWFMYFALGYSLLGQVLCICIQMLGSNEAHQRISSYSHCLFATFSLVLISFPIPPPRFKTALTHFMLLIDACQARSAKGHGNMTLQEMTIRKIPNDSSIFSPCYPMGFAYLI